MGGNVFDLERSIAEWRNQMLAAGIKFPVPLDELEIHLREEIERQVRSGLNPQQAFEAAAQQIGEAKAVKSEFNKIERKIMTRIAIIGLGIFAILVGRP